MPPGILELHTTPLAGCFELVPRIFTDARGRFVNLFEEVFFAEHGLETRWAVEYHSTSVRGVLRGLHAQAPPEEQIKLVTCVAGAVFDVAVDLRAGSPTYGRHHVFELSEEKANAAYIPGGFAHGFCALSDRATVLYKVSRVQSRPHELGIRWDSAGISWPLEAPTLSERDAALPPLSELETPFRIGS